MSTKTLFTVVKSSFKACSENGATLGAPEPSTCFEWVYRWYLGYLLGFKLSDVGIYWVHRHIPLLKGSHLVGR